MKTLKLLFSKEGLQYQILHKKNVEEEKALFVNEDISEQDISNELDNVLSNSFSNIEVLSAINHFAMMPRTFSHHEMGKDLIAYNANIDKENEELMLSINEKFKVQFYYSFPLKYYKRIKYLRYPAPTRYNFTGEKFLNSINTKKEKSIHIHLYQHQCEFIALDEKKVILYNNLDVDSEVDFLYFIMFTLKKIGFTTTETHFYLYGETTIHETFISELQKFVKKIDIVFDNLHKKNFILY